MLNIGSSIRNGPELLNFLQTGALKVQLNNGIKVINWWNYGNQKSMWAKNNKQHSKKLF